MPVYPATQEQFVRALLPAMDTVCAWCQVEGLGLGAWGV